ncbi:MAG: hypothetical protein JXR78_04730 [Victivallales bacterium]|nr:hypothetical protein [Victivallales bacterium]
MKVTKSKIVSLIGAISLLAAGGCSDANVEVVKNGFFSNYKEATIGTILQERFDDCKWSSSKESARTIVTFTGKISKATHDLAMKRFQSELTLETWFRQIENYPMEVVPNGLVELHKKKIKQYDYEAINVDFNLPDFKKALEKRAKTEHRIMRECFDELYWPTGSEVELKWIIYPDGETFELSSISNTSWNNFCLGWNEVLKILFSR